MELYDKFHVAASGVSLVQMGNANLNPWTEAKVNTKNPDRGPLLIIDGEKDHTVPWSIANAAYKRQKVNPGVTEIVQIANRGHSLTIDHGWREVAELALNFVKEYAYRSALPTSVSIRSRPGGSTPRWAEDHPGVGRTVSIANMLHAAQPTCFLIADISGYTGYLADVELDHAQDILADLIGAVVTALRPNFRLAKLEGDAAFTYMIAETVDGSMLLDTIERCYSGSAGVVVTSARRRRASATPAPRSRTST